MLEVLLIRLFGPRVASRVVPWLALLALAGSTYLLARIFGASAKLETWLFWRYALVWLCCGVFAVACFSAGGFIVSKLWDDAQRNVTYVTLSCATGVFAFHCVTTLVGFLHGYGKVAFFFIPLALFALGAKQLRRDVAEFRARFRENPSWLRLQPLEVLAFAVGGLALFVIYLGVLVPENAAYDSRWYHLALAESYAAGGSIHRSVEGSVTSTVPHLASIIYSWAFCLPVGGLFEKVELCAHLEFVIFAMSLPGVVALVRYLVPGAKANAAWLAMFVFPSLFVYDSSLHNASDHIAALWSIPIYLTFCHAYQQLSLRGCLLFALQVSATLMCKYTAAIAVVGPVAVLTLRGLWLVGRSLWRKQRELRPLGSLFATLGAGLLLTSPHWLKNLIWHGDPVYPILRHHLKVQPWNGGGEYLFDAYQSVAWAATGTTAEKLKGLFKALYDHSFGLYTWGDFHGTYPVFGSLFTFGLVVLPLLAGTRRIWPLVLMTHLGIGMWFWLFHFERYLQSLVPWMAAVIVSLALLAWRSGWAARAGVIALGGLQIVWGSDMIFWPLHRMTGKSQIGLANDFFAKGYGPGGGSRVKPFEDHAAFGRVLPSGARVLIHHEHTRLGINAQSVIDATRIQYGINYAELGSSRAVDDWFRDNGITHVIWQNGVIHGDETLGGDLVFHSYTKLLPVLTTYGGRTLAKLPAQPPPPREPATLVYLCDGTYQPGIYPVSALNVSPWVAPNFPKKFAAPSVPFVSREDALARPLGYAVVNSACKGAPSLKSGFTQIAASGTTRYFVRE